MENAVSATLRDAWATLLDLSLRCNYAIFSTTAAFCTPFAQNHLLQLAHNKAEGVGQKRSALDKRVCRFFHRLVLEPALHADESSLGPSSLLFLCFVFEDQKVLLGDIRTFCSNIHASSPLNSDAFQRHLLKVLGGLKFRENRTALKAYASFCRYNSTFAVLLLQQRVLLMALIAAYYDAALTQKSVLWQLMSLGISANLRNKQPFEPAILALLTEMSSDHRLKSRQGRNFTALSAFIEERSVISLLRRVRGMCPPDSELQNVIASHLTDLGATVGVTGSSSSQPEHAHTNSVDLGSTKAKKDQRTTAHPPRISRANFFDGDEFDDFNVLSSQISFGSKGTQDHLLVEHDRPNKDKIYAALSLFESDDDEMDDTYDADDVGGLVDGNTFSESPDYQAGGLEKEDRLLYAIWKSNPSVFEKSRQARSTDARKSLRSNCHLTDEQIEGWASMLMRTPQKMRRLANQYLDAGGGPYFAGTEEPISSAAQELVPVPIPRNAGGSAVRREPHEQLADPQSQFLRRRKETAKASRSNHGRKAGRAKKTRQTGLDL